MSLLGRLVSSGLTGKNRFKPQEAYRGPSIGSPGSSNKTFAGDLRLINQWLQYYKPFSLVRFGDGEMKIVQGEPSDLSSKYNGEHKYIPGQVPDEKQRKILEQSLHYQNDRYFVGIACPCCVGEENFNMLRDESRQSDINLTWANVFVNSNYKIFLEETTPLFANKPVNIVCHSKADIQGLPFTVKRVFSTNGNAWLKDHERVNTELDVYIEQDNVAGEIFLFCAGVLSNILVMEMTEKHPQNTYVDLGSVYDAMMGLGATRKYLKKGKNLRKTCVWA